MLRGAYRLLPTSTILSIHYFKGQLTIGQSALLLFRFDAEQTK